MRTRMLQSVGAAVLAVALGVSAVRAGEPVVGVDLGAAVPLSDFRRTVNPGATIAPFAGYKFGHAFAVTPLIQLNYTGFGTNRSDEQNTTMPTGTAAGNSIRDIPSSSFGDVTDLFSVGGGARFSLNDEGKEVFFQATGGWYKNLAGALDDSDGDGWAFGGGFNYEFGFLPPGMALGLYVRLDQSSIHAAADSNRDLRYLTTGFSLRHRFLPPPELPPARVAEARPAPPPPPVVKKIVLRGVNFDFDKATLRADAKPILDEAARTLKQETSLRISVEGHTDSRGTDAYNQKLSERRAATVLNYLADHGVERSRMTAIGYGESRPVASNDTDDGRAQNRRVELRVVE